MSRQDVEDADRYVVRMSIRQKRPIYTCHMRKYMKGFLLKDQCPTVHVQALVRRCIAKGYLKHIGRGEYQLTELGAAWCGAANVAKL